MRFYRALVWPVQAVVILACGCALAYVGVDYADAKMAKARAAEAVCRAQLEAVKARNPSAAKWMHPSDPCLSMEIVSR